MVEIEGVHAGVWRKRLKAAGVDTSRMNPAWRARALMFVARHFGPGLVVPTIAEREASDEAMYDDQPEALARMPGDERSHARLFRELAGGRGVEGGAIARIEGRHRGSGGNQLRAAVLGANDGLVSNLSISMGVAGASSGGHAVLIAGLAGCWPALRRWRSGSGFPSRAPASCTPTRSRSSARSSSRSPTRKKRS